jgi:adenylate cyclase
MERKLAAILCADVYGYSRLMGENEEATLRTFSSYRKIIDGLIAEHRGRFVNSAGDSVLAEFASVVEAVNSAVGIQAALKTENASLPTERRMEFRIGVNLGDVMVEGEQIYGDGVNVAARLESLAEPGGICISGKVYDEVGKKLGLNCADLGEQRVKNIAEPVRAWRVLPKGTAPRVARRPARSYWRSGVLSLTGIAIIVATIFVVQHVSLKAPHTHASIPPQEKPALPLPDKPSIAVLPFSNLSGDRQQDYFSDGISDELINYLSRVPGLFVIARDSSFSYKGKAVKEQEIGRELGVKYVLEGSVRKAADRIRIGAELVDASSDTEMWTQNYDRPLKDIFAVQDDIVGKVSTTVGLILKLEEMKTPHGYAGRTDNIEAFDDLLRSVEYWTRFTKEDFSKSREWLNKAIKVDPGYASAYAYLSSGYSGSVLFGYSENPGADLATAEKLASKALELNDSESLAFVALCRVHWLERQFDRAETECRRGVTIDPNSASAYVELADVLTVADKAEEAERAAQTAARLDPTRPDFYAYFIAAPLTEMGRYQDAIPLLKRHVAAYPGQPWAHILLVVAYSELGRDADARAEAMELKRVDPSFTMRDADVGRDSTLKRLIFADLPKAGLK